MIFSPSGEQPELRVSAHTVWQSTSGCIAIFHKYCCFTKHVGIVQICYKFDSKKSLVYITDMSKYHSAGIGSMD